VIYDKKVKVEKRVERAQALVIIGEIFAKAERDPDEEGDYMAFEQLMAEATAKKEKKGDDKAAAKKKEREEAKAAYDAKVKEHEKSRGEEKERRKSRFGHHHNARASSASPDGKDS